MPPKPKGASPTPRGRSPATSLGGDSVEGKTEAVGVYGRFRPAAKGMPEGPIEMLSAHKVQVREYEFTLDGVFEQITTQQQVARLPILTSQPVPQPMQLPSVIRQHGRGRFMTRARAKMWRRWSMGSTQL